MEATSLSYIKPDSYDTVKKPHLIMVTRYALMKHEGHQTICPGERDLAGEVDKSMRLYAGRSMVQSHSGATRVWVHCHPTRINIH